MMKPPCCSFSFFLLVFTSLSISGTTRAGEYGDYVDPTFNCPATITCPRVCVATVQDCPVTMQCPNGTALCTDGTCAGTCDDDDLLESPCEFDCAKVACPRVIDFEDACEELYGDYYTNETICGEEEVVAETKLLQFNEPGYIFAYVWVSGITFLTLVWCFFNQKLSPVTGSTKPLHVAKELAEGSLCEHTGYKRHPLGLFLHYLTLATFCGWNILLCWLTIQYYALDENPYVSRRKLQFQDEEQLLKTFIITWSVGFAWCFFLFKWPHSIRSIFLRRCVFQKATFVAVYLELPKASNDNDTYQNGCSCLVWTKKVLNKAFRLLNALMCLLFSDTNCYHHKDGVLRYCRVQTDAAGIRYFVFLFRRYNYDAETDSFVPGLFSVGDTLGDFGQAGQTCLTSEQVQERMSIVGHNVIETEKPFFLKVLGKEFAKPFYTYQLFMIWSWFPLYYYYMALVWSVVIATSAFTVAFFHYRNLLNLYRITHMEGQAQVLRDDGDYVPLDHENLVPGDVVKLNPGITYCDMIVISGQATLVDESALTGEAAPQAKAPIDPMESEKLYDRVLHKRHTISAGTTILESEEGVAVVMNTGSFTAKGELLREMFSFRRYQFKFDHEVAIVLAILVLYAIFGFNMVVYFIEDTAVYGWFYGIYVVGTILPPLLPTVFTVSVGISDNRLANQRIATVNSESILIAGKVTRAFFDKTGTLTKQGLDFMFARSATKWGDKASGEISNELHRAMSCCHNLTKSQTGALVGNPVDLTMFASSGALSFETKATSSIIVDQRGHKLKVLRHFDFDQHRMTQGVIVELHDGSHIAIIKGSGESIQKICQTNTLPDNFESELRDSSRDGMYQISVASKPINKEDVSNLTRDEVESDLEFLGVLNFQNVIREDTPDVIRQLAEGEIQSIMVTGDSVQTGIRVAQESGIMEPNKPVIIGTVDSTGVVAWSDDSGGLARAPSTQDLESGETQLALSGAAYEALCNQDPKEAARIIQHVRVFGRCTPREKVLVVDSFVSLGYITLMCGDGGNDCGALKAAHVGVALSDAEASIVAPFTALDKNISSVLDVLKEGRCALFSALSTYKFIIMYGQIETINQIINAYFQITFTEWCWVFMDGIWTISLGMSLPLARPANRLAETRPTASVLGPWTMFSTLGVLSINFIFAVIALAALWNQDWFQCRKWDDNDVSNVLVIGDNYESEVLFLVTGFQYIASAIVFNFGYEFRQVWWRNYAFMTLVAFFTFLQFYITMVPGNVSCIWRVNCINEDTVKGVTAHDAFPIQNPYGTTVMPESFRGKILAIMISNLIAIWAYDYLVVNGVRKYLAKKKRAHATTAVSRGGKKDVSVDSGDTTEEPRGSETNEKIKSTV